MKKYNMHVLKTIILIISSSFWSCKKLVDVNLPTNQLSNESVFQLDNTAIGYLTGIYSSMCTMDNGGTKGFLSLSSLPGLSADELRISDTQTANLLLRASYTNALATSASTENRFPEYWNNFYSLIYRANAAIEGLQKSKTLTPTVKQQLLGEAMFIRAYLHFYLVNLYGDIPIVLSTDYRINNSLARFTKEKVYEQIIQDLKDAQLLLSKSYLSGTLLNITIDRVRPTYWAATALLARVYLYAGTKYYAAAEIEATKVIENNSLYKLVNLNQTFLRTSEEVIWALQPIAADQNTREGAVFLLTGAPSTADDLHPYFISSDLLNSFESGDPRKTEWVKSLSAGGTTYFYPAKYKIGTLTPVNGIYPAQTEYSVLLRLGEVYLNRAEARARQGKIQDCVSDLNVIRQRARGNGPITGLPDYTSTLSQTDAVTACIKERRIELFSEMGHRWFDLKRTGLVDQVMTLAAQGKNTTWNSNWALYPIPYSELLNNSALTQNPGY